MKALLWEWKRAFSDPNISPFKSIFGLLRKTELKIGLICVRRFSREGELKNWKIEFKNLDSVAFNLIFISSRSWSGSVQKENKEKTVKGYDYYFTFAVFTKLSESKFSYNVCPNVFCVLTYLFWCLKSWSAFEHNVKDTAWQCTASPIERRLEYEVDFLIIPPPSLS